MPFGLYHFLWLGLRIRGDLSGLICLLSPVCGECPVEVIRYAFRRGGRGDDRGLLEGPGDLGDTLAEEGEADLSAGPNGCILEARG